MKPGESLPGEAFSFINPDVGKHIKTVTKVDGSNYKISTKGFGTGLMLKDNSTITIKSNTSISKLNISNAYHITINGLTALGRSRIYQNMWVKVIPDI